MLPSSMANASRGIAGVPRFGTNTIEISESLRFAGSLPFAAGPSVVGPTLTNRDHSVVVLAPYGLTATTASSSVVGLCRDVTVTHSPGFTVLIAVNALSGTLMRIVRY